MKKVICLVLIALFVLTTTAAFAGQGSSSSATPEGGWQRLYEDVEAWSTDAEDPERDRKKTEKNVQLAVAIEPINGSPFKKKAPSIPDGAFFMLNARRSRLEPLPGVSKLLAFKRFQLGVHEVSADL